MVSQISSRRRTERGQTIVVLLAGGTKNEQSRDIQTALALKNKL